MVMTPGTPTKRFWVPLWFRPRARRRKRQEALDNLRFWGLVNDHNWLQYHPVDERLRHVIHKPRRPR